MSNKEYIYIEKNTTKIPIQEGYEQKKKGGYEQTIHPRENTNSEHVGKCSIPCIIKEMKLIS